MGMGKQGDEKSEKRETQKQLYNDKGEKKVTLHRQIAQAAFVPLPRVLLCGCVRGILTWGNDNIEGHFFSSRFSILPV